MLQRANDFWTAIPVTCRTWAQIFVCTMASNQTRLKGAELLKTNPCDSCDMQLKEAGSTREEHPYQYPSMALRTELVSGCEATSWAGRWGHPRPRPAWPNQSQCRMTQPGTTFFLDPLPLASNPPQPPRRPKPAGALLSLPSHQHPWKISPPPNHHPQAKPRTRTRTNKATRPKRKRGRKKKEENESVKREKGNAERDKPWIRTLFVSSAARLPHSLPRPRRQGDALHLRRRRRHALAVGCPVRAAAPASRSPCRPPRADPC